eukprot:358262-Chlamydomonas_euryale.AAC.17
MRWTETNRRDPRDRRKLQVICAAPRSVRPLACMRVVRVGALERGGGARTRTLSNSAIPRKDAASPPSLTPLIRQGRLRAAHLAPTHEP